MGNGVGRIRGWKKSVIGGGIIASFFVSVVFFYLKIMSLVFKFGKGSITSALSEPCNTSM